MSQLAERIRRLELWAWGDQAPERLPALSDLTVSQWQDISTAPADQEFLIYFPSFEDGEGYVSESFVEVCQKWSDGSIVGSRTHSEYRAATHWMPLPPAPEVSL